MPLPLLAIGAVAAVAGTYTTSKYLGSSDIADKIEDTVEDGVEWASEHMGTVAGGILGGVPGAVAGAVYDKWTKD